MYKEEFKEIGETAIRKGSLRDDLISLFSKYNEVQKNRNQQDLLISNLEGEVKLLVKDKKELEKTWTTLRNLLDKFSAQSIGKLADLLNKGVQSIFTDKDYSIKIEISDTKRKQMKIILCENRDGDIIENNLSDTSAILLMGGGVLVTVSLIFQVYLILHYEKRRVMFVDEGFGQVSTQYIENFFQFLKYLSSKMGFTFMCINHDPRFEQYFDKVYKVNKGNYSLIKKLRS